MENEDPAKCWSIIELTEKLVAGRNIEVSWPLCGRVALMVSTLCQDFRFNLLTVGASSAQPISLNREIRSGTSLTTSCQLSAARKMISKSASK